MESPKIDPFIPALPEHGGDLSYATALYGMPSEGWLDLSTGINPNGYTAPPVISRNALSRLPEVEDYAALNTAARTAYEIASAVDVVAVPGTELAIRLMPLVSPPGPVAIVGHTYGSHESAWRNAGREVIPIQRLEDAPAETRIVVLCNPNNPDGRIAAPQTLHAVSHALANQQGLLIVDEAYADLRPDLSLVPHLQEAPAIVLRSVGKFYGLAGIRVGFAIGVHPAIQSLRTLLGAWAVAAPSAVTAAAALADTQWQEQKRRRLRYDGERLRKMLKDHRLEIVGGTDLFALVSDVHAQPLHATLAEQGIWTRIFAHEKRWIRFGLPTEAGFARLEQALSRVSWLSRV